MAYAPRFRNPFREEEIATPKQREELAKRKDELIGEMNARLDQLPNSHEKDELIRKRDHCIAKFPKLPADLSVWMVAYFEDFMRDYQRIA
jgi:hypothetical protein